MHPDNSRYEETYERKREPPATTFDLFPSERTFLGDMHRLGHGRYEFLRIRNSELALDPWPTAIRDVKFGAQDLGCEKELSGEFRLKRQVRQLFEYIRSVQVGEIRLLEVANGLPFSMRIQHMPEDKAEVRRA